MSAPVRPDPASEVCRGCGGTGLGHSLTPREFQLAHKQFYARKGSEFNGVKSNQVASLEVTTAAHPERKRLHGEGPLSYILELIEHYKSIGFVEFETDPDWLATLACDWCHGTGVPQLSKSYLELYVARLEAIGATARRIRRTAERHAR